jgi:hypothetical protein
MEDIVYLKNENSQIAKKVEIRDYYCGIVRNKTSDEDKSEEEKTMRFQELTPYPGITFTDILVFMVEVPSSFSFAT